MADPNIDHDFSHVCRMTLQTLLQTRDLSHPLLENHMRKDGKDCNQMFPDASAAFLGPTLWDEYTTAFIDIDNFLGENQNNGQRIIENLETKSHTNELQPLPPETVPNIPLPGMCPSVQDSPQSQTDSVSMHGDFSDVDDKRVQSYAVDCKFSPSELALATPPGHKHYDPASTVFPEDELKPQPILKKSRKNFVPDNMKDDKYWARRLKNNIAAKRSREARRFKENQIVLRASYLEKENNTLKEDVIRLQAENNMLKEKIKKYEK